MHGVARSTPRIWSSHSILCLHFPLVAVSLGWFFSKVPFWSDFRPRNKAKDFAKPLRLPTSSPSGRLPPLLTTY
jgi:hypothetical protein